MKKIKHMQDLQQEKMRLRIQQLELEKSIGSNWNELKEELRPGTFIRNKLTDLTHTKTEKGHLFSDLLSHGAGYFSRRLTEMAGQKLETTVQQGMGKLMKKMTAVLKKNKR